MNRQNPIKKSNYSQMASWLESLMAPAKTWALSRRLRKYGVYRRSFLNILYIHMDFDCPEVLADVVESTVGAVFTDSNCSIDMAWEVASYLLKPMITPESLQTNAVKKLFEMCQKHKLKVRLVDLWSQGGTCKVFVNNQLKGKGICHEKKEIALNRAANDAYKEVVRRMDSGRIRRRNMAVRTGVVKAALAIMAVCLAGYIVVPPLYWHLKEGIAAVSGSSSKYCPPCDCDCDIQPLLSISQELNSTSFSDCAKHDPEVNEDTQKNFAELLSEELKTREAETMENHRRADMALLEAKKMTSQYQKEADKCNSGMETCEEAREKAEAALLDQKQLTAMWELRARQKGWSESRSQPLW